MTLPFPLLPSITIFSKTMAGSLEVGVGGPSAVAGDAELVVHHDDDEFLALTLEQISFLFVSFWLFMRFLYVFFLKCFVFSEKSINFAT